MLSTPFSARPGTSPALSSATPRTTRQAFEPSGRDCSISAAWRTSLLWRGRFFWHRAGRSSPMRVRSPVSRRWLRARTSWVTEPWDFRLRACEWLPPAICAGRHGPGRLHARTGCWRACTRARRRPAWPGQRGKLRQPGSHPLWAQRGLRSEAQATSRHKMRGFAHNKKCGLPQRREDRVARSEFGQGDPISLSGGASLTQEWAHVPGRTAATGICQQLQRTANV